MSDEMEDCFGGDPDLGLLECCLEKLDSARDWIDQSPSAKRDTEMRLAVHETIEAIRFLEAAVRSLVKGKEGVTE